MFERLPSGVRLTPLGDAAADLARHILHEIDAAEEKIDATLSGRTGSFQVTAPPMWMQAVLAPVLARFHRKAPGIELKLRTAPFAEGLRLLANGESEMHCGGIDSDEPLPPFLRRERFLNMTAGIVANEGHPLLAAAPAVGDLAGYPWIDYDTPVPAVPGDGRPSLKQLLDRLTRDTGRRVTTVVQAGSVGLFLMATGAWLSWLPLNFLDGLSELHLRPLQTEYGRFPYRAGFIARRSAEDLEPFRLLENEVRKAALERSEPPPR